MKVKSLVAALLVVAAPVAFANGAAAQTAPAKPVPQTAEEWLKRMTDMTQNLSAYKDPKVFVPWLNAVTEPGFYTQMGMNMMEPGEWLRMMNSMVQPGAYSNVMQLFADPDVYMKWLAASMDPNFYTAVLTTLTDPGKLMRWVMSPVDAKTLQMMLKPLDPNVYVRWAMSPLDPRAMQLMMAPLNPNLYMGWLGASMNPASYGQAWGNWMGYAAQPGAAVPAAAAAPAATGYGAAPTIANPFDPNVWAQMFTIPGVTAPAAPGAYTFPFPLPTAPAAPAAPAAK
jgi:hypothetical protein